MLKKLTALIFASVFTVFGASSALADDASNGAPEQQESMQKPADDSNAGAKAEDEQASKDANSTDAMDSTEVDTQ